MVRYRRFSLLLLATFIIAIPVNRDSAHAQPPTVRIGSWNIANLHAVEHQKPEGRGFAKARDSQHYDWLKQTATEIAFDAVALQEIHSVDAVHRVFPAADWHVCFENGRKAADQSRPITERVAIYTAVAVRKSRFDSVSCFEASELAILHKEDDGVTRLVRGGTGALVKKGDVSFTLLSVHLKSNCAVKKIAPPEDDHCQTLGKQIPILNKWIDEAYTNSSALIVAGDFNRVLGGDGDQFWPGIDDMVPPGLNLYRIPYTNDDDAEKKCVDRFYQLDHIVFTKQVFDGASKVPQYVKNTFRRLPIPGPTPDDREHLSDHCPIWGDFKWPS